MNGASERTRSYRLLQGERLALEIRGEPGVLVSTSAPPPLPGTPPVTHPFATAGFHLAEAEGELGALLRESSDIDAFLEAADRAGYRTRPRWADPRRTFRTGARELMVSILPAEVTAFIVEASRLPADALDEVRRAENSRLRAST